MMGGDRLDRLWEGPWRGGADLRRGRPATPTSTSFPRPCSNQRSSPTGAGSAATTPVRRARRHAAAMDQGARPAAQVPDARHGRLDGPHAAAGHRGTRPDRRRRAAGARLGRRLGPRSATAECLCRGGASTSPPPSATPISPSTTAAAARSWPALDVRHTATPAAEGRRPVLERRPDGRGGTR